MHVRVYQSCFGMHLVVTGSPAMLLAAELSSGAAPLVGGNSSSQAAAAWPCLNMKPSSLPGACSLSNFCAADSNELTYCASSHVHLGKAQLNFSTERAKVSSFYVFGAVFAPLPNHSVCQPSALLACSCKRPGLQKAASAASSASAHTHSNLSLPRVQGKNCTRARGILRGRSTEVGGSTP